MTPRGKTRLKIWLALAGVFAFGSLTGAALDSAYRLRSSGDERREARGRRGREDIFEGMKRDLDLSEQQATEIGAILEQTRNGYRALRAECRPRYDALRQDARARMRALLTPEQQQQFDARVAERDAKRDKEDRIRN